ncbi:hypothetical protein DFJ58DRAFT_762074, partial [Suillus subalutaceus]|uniref:uncharacterized protein n=1 Tax=Suillus subalutaceus TaxID=48586 RepID=UPI001B87F56B
MLCCFVAFRSNVLLTGLYSSLYALVCFRSPCTFFLSMLCCFVAFHSNVLLTGLYFSLDALVCFRSPCTFFLSMLCCFSFQRFI